MNSRITNNSMISNKADKGLSNCHSKFMARKNNKILFLLIEFKVEIQLKPL